MGILLCVVKRKMEDLGEHLCVKVQFVSAYNIWVARLLNDENNLIKQYVNTDRQNLFDEIEAYLIQTYQKIEWLGEPKSDEDTLNMLNQLKSIK